VRERRVGGWEGEGARKHQPAFPARFVFVSLVVITVLICPLRPSISLSLPCPLPPTDLGGPRHPEHRGRAARVPLLLGDRDQQHGDGLPRPAPLQPRRHRQGVCSPPRADAVPRVYRPLLLSMPRISTAALGPCREGRGGREVRARQEAEERHRQAPHAHNTTIR